MPVARARRYAAQKPAKGDLLAVGYDEIAAAYLLPRCVPQWHATYNIPHVMFRYKRHCALPARRACVRVRARACACACVFVHIAAT